MYTKKIGWVFRLVAEEYGVLEGARVCMKLLGLDTAPLDEAISKQREDDGGPGSGNWGHKGRPGLVGGSGKGGGVKFRGGNENVYAGKRTEWANGLTGENNRAAHALIKKYGTGSSAREQTRSAETLIMRKGTRAEKQQMLKLKGQGLGLNDERGNIDTDKLRELAKFNGMSEDKQEQMLKLIDSAQDTDGSINEQLLTGSDFQGDYFDGAFEPEISEYYMALKSEALGGEKCVLPVPEKLKKAIQNGGAVVSEVTKPAVGQREAEIDKANTAEEISTAMKKSGATRSDADIQMSDLDVNEQRNIAKGIARVVDVFPCMNGWIKSVKTAKLQDRQVGECSMYLEGTPLSFTSKISNMRNAISNSCKRGWFPITLQGVEPTIVIVSHEMGHALDGRISNHLGLTKKALFSNGENNLYSSRVIKEVSKKFGLRYEELRKSVSKYANDKGSDREWFAECISEAVCASEPREIAKAVYEIVKRDVKKYGLE